MKQDFQQSRHPLPAAVKLFLDDVRPVPDGWVCVRTFFDFKGFVQALYDTHRTLPKIISFDHDLSLEHYQLDFDRWRDSPEIADLEETGYDAAKWLIEFCESRGLELPPCFVHSANPPGAQNIVNLLNDHLKRKGLPTTVKRWSIPPPTEPAPGVTGFIKG